MRATNLLLAVRALWWRDLAGSDEALPLRAKGMGSRVIVTEVDPVRALEALMEGFDVMPMQKLRK